MSATVPKEPLPSFRGSCGGCPASRSTEGPSLGCRARLPRARQCEHRPVGRRRQSVSLGGGGQDTGSVAECGKCKDSAPPSAPVCSPPQGLAPLEGPPQTRVSVGVPVVDPGGQLRDGEGTGSNANRQDTLGSLSPVLVTEQRVYHVETSQAVLPRGSGTSGGGPRCETRSALRTSPWLPWVGAGD